MPNLRAWYSEEEDGRKVGGVGKWRLDRFSPAGKVISKNPSFPHVPFPLILIMWIPQSRVQVHVWTQAYWELRWELKQVKMSWHMKERDEGCGNGEAYGQHRLVSKFKYYSRKK